MFPIHVRTFPFRWRLIAMCVQSIAPITLGKPAISANCALMFAWFTASYGNRIGYLAEMRMMIPFNEWRGSELYISIIRPDVMRGPENM